MRLIGLAIVLLLAAPQEPPDETSPESSSPQRRSLDFRVFDKIDKPITGRWSLEIPDARAVTIALAEVTPGSSSALVGRSVENGDELLRLERKKEGIGYQGQLLRVFSSCGLDAVAVSEFLPLGDAIVMNFGTPPSEAPCPPIDGGRAGRFRVVTARGGAVRLRDMTEISSDSVRSTYSIGGDRPEGQPAASYGIPIGAVSVDSGSEVRFLKRLKAPLDGSYWFEVEAVISPESGIEAPRGFVKAESLRFEGSLTLRRLEPAS